MNNTERVLLRPYPQTVFWKWTQFRLLWDRKNGSKSQKLAAILGFLRFFKNWSEIGQFLKIAICQFWRYLGLVWFFANIFFFFYRKIVLLNKNRGVENRGKIFFFRERRYRRGGSPPKSFKNFRPKRTPINNSLM
jgi:hypothetical protein